MQNFYLVHFIIKAQEMQMKFISSFSFVKELIFFRKMSVEKSDLLLLLSKPYVPFYVPRKSVEEAKRIVAPSSFLPGSTYQPIADNESASATAVEIPDLEEDEKLLIENLRVENENFFSVFIKSHAERSAKLTKIFMGEFEVF